MKSGSGMKIHEEPYLKARHVIRAFKRAQVARLLGDPNIVGAAFGRRVAHGETTDDPALVVYVRKKVSKAFIPPSRLLPRRVYVGNDGVELDVVETGTLYPQEFTARLRPAPAGVSIGHPAITAGTLGGVVIDNTDGSACILSNNHVMANQNAATIGDSILQPGAFDGGMDPGDVIALLKRFVTINATGNTVDGAIAQITSRDAVVDQIINDLIPVANSDHPVIGLLFAGSCNRTIMNPIADVLTQLNISFPAGAGAIAAADIGMNVEKVGRTTEYTTSTVKEIDATVTINYDFGPATFDNQIVTAALSQGGDSGSLVFRGGAGGDEDQCGCGTQTAAEAALQTSLKQERCMADEVRDKFLRHTKIGRYAIDLFFLNEENLLDRNQKTKIAEDDRDFLKKMFAKYNDEVKQAFVEAEKSERRLTDQHLRDIQTGLKRAEAYMRKDETDAANKLFALAKKHATGKTPRELLALLNNDDLFDEVKQITSKVKSIKKKGDCC